MFPRHRAILRLGGILTLLYLTVCTERCWTAANDPCSVSVEEWEETYIPCNCGFPTKKGSSDKMVFCQKSIHWTKLGTGFVGTCTTSGVIIEEKFQGYMTILTDGSLNIFSANTSHHATFRCEELEGDTTDTTLFVEVPPSDPEIIDFLPAAKEEQQYLATCVIPRVRPLNLVTIYWATKSLDHIDTIVVNETLNHDGTSRVVTHANLTFYRTDNHYPAWCVATWKGDDRIYSNTSKTVVVVFGPRNNTMMIWPEDAQREGFTQDFICISGSSNPATTMRWMVNGVNMSHQAEELHQDGEYGGQYVTSRLSIVVSRQNFGHNVSCIPRFLGATVDGLDKSSLINTTYPNDVQVQTVTSATEGEQVVLLCMVENGNPEHADLFEWTFQSKYAPSEEDAFDCTEQTCIISSIQRHHAGVYTCYARSWHATLFGTGSTALSVVYPAHVVMNTTKLDVYAEQGDSVQLVANLVVWPEDVTIGCQTTDLEDIDQSSIETVITGEEQVRVTVSIADVDHQRHEYITCKGHNSAGDGSEFVFKLRYPGPPEEPYAVAVAYTSSNFLTLKFTAGLDGGSKQTFSALYRRLQEPDFLHGEENIEDPGNGNETSIKLTGLNSDVGYEVKIRATNGFNGTGGNTSESGIQNHATKRSPFVRDINISEDGEWTVIEWTLDGEFSYTTQFIQQCCSIYTQSDLSCDRHLIEHGDSARLRLDEDTDYAVHILLYDQDEEVYRELAYQSESNVIVSCSGCTLWIVLFSVFTAVAILVAVALGCFVRRCRKDKQLLKQQGLTEKRLTEELGKEKRSLVLAKQQLEKQPKDTSGAAVEMNYYQNPALETPREAENQGLDTPREPKTAYEIHRQDSNEQTTNRL